MFVFCFKKGDIILVAGISSIDYPLSSVKNEKSQKIPPKHVN